MELKDYTHSSYLQSIQSEAVEDALTDVMYELSKYIPEANVEDVYALLLDSFGVLDKDYVQMEKQLEDLEGQAEDYQAEVDDLIEEIDRLNETINEME